MMTARGRRIAHTTCIDASERHHHVTETPSDALCRILKRTQTWTQLITREDISLPSTADACRR